MAKKAVAKAVKKKPAVRVAAKVAPTKTVSTKPLGKSNNNGHKKPSLVVAGSALATKSPAMSKPAVAARGADKPTNTKLVIATKVLGKSVKRLKRRDDDERYGPPRPLVPLPPPPVTTNSKPKKNQAGLSQRELDEFRNHLFLKRRELLGDMSSMEREALQSGQGSNLSNLPVHMADMGTDNYEQEFTLGLVEKDRGLLREINQALAKIQDGTYGICEGTGKPIPKARLEIQPWAKYSVEWARQLEKNMMIRR